MSRDLESLYGKIEAARLGVRPRIPSGQFSPTAGTGLTLEVLKLLGPPLRLALNCYCARFTHCLQVGSGDHCKKPYVAQEGLTPAGGALPD